MTKPLKQKLKLKKKRPQTIFSSEPDSLLFTLAWPVAVSYEMARRDLRAFLIGIEILSSNGEWAILEKKGCPHSGLIGFATFDDYRPKRCAFSISGSKVEYEATVGSGPRVWKRLGGKSFAGPFKNTDEVLERVRVDFPQIFDTDIIVPDVDPEGPWK